MKKIKHFLASIILISVSAPSLVCCSKSLDNHYLWITSNVDFTIYCKLSGQTGVSFPNIQYSDDYGLTWWKISEDKPSVHFTKGRSIAIKGDNPNGLSTKQTYFSIDIESGQTKDESTAKISGRLMSLIDNGSDKSDKVPNDYCFYRLFENNDTGNIIQEADLIFPTTFTHGCFSRMFARCSKLHSLKVDFKDWNDDQQSFSDWLLDVSANGTFTCPSELDIQRDASHIPEGWEIKNNA